jgi:hypothetical protein
MSKLITSQKMEMTCEACGKQVEWELVGADQDPVILQAMQSWYTVARKVIDPRTGALTQMMGDACGLECVTVVAVKLAVPPQDAEPADNIDLASLRAANFKAN